MKGSQSSFERPSKDIVKRFQKLHKGKSATATISDAFDSLGIRGIAVGINPLWEGATITGPAFTIKQVAARKSRKKLTLHTEALVGMGEIEYAQPGDVAVIDTGGRYDIVSGGGCAFTCAQIRGIEGVVVDGTTRDSDWIRHIKFPVFCRGTSPITSIFRLETIAINEPIECGGIQVRPGDIIVGDGDGIAVIPKEDAKEVLVISERLEDNDRIMIERLRQGKTWEEAGKGLKWFKPPPSQALQR